MAKLEENYLNLLRNTFYNTTNVKHTESGAGASSKTKSLKKTGTGFSGINIKQNKPNLKTKAVTSSHLQEQETGFAIEHNTINKDSSLPSSSGTKRRKRLASVSDISDITAIKRKPQKPITKPRAKTLGSLSNKKRRKYKGWSVLKPSSHNTKSSFGGIIEVSDRKEKVLKKPKIQKIRKKAEPFENGKFNMANFNAENASDIYDNEKVLVKAMKFKAFCNLFLSTCNEQLEKYNKPFTIPIRYFKDLKEDDIDWSIEQHVNKSNTIVENHNKSLSKTQVNKLDNNENSLLENHDVDIQQQENIDLPVEVSHINKETRPANIINMKNGIKIIILPHLNQIVHFTGLSYLKVLFGEVDILGALLNVDTKEQKVYSPRGTSLLYIKNKSKSYKSSKIALKEIVSEEMLTTQDAHLSFEQHCAILLCTQLNEPFIQFIENHISQKIFPELTDQEPRIDFEFSGQWNKIRVSEVWEDVLENIHDHTKAIICGGKGAGKSTFLRYAVNVMLNKFEKVRVVDLDPGQSEFCPPGCISVTTVKDYVLGPNYTHFQSTDRSILSHINVGHNMKQYLKSIKKLATMEDDTENLPTLINFPGYTQGLGLNITAHAFELLLPTLVIEIKCRNDSKNYKVDMTPENVNDILNSSDLLEPKNATRNLNYDYKKLPSLSCLNNAWSLEARQAREICIFSYFGRMMTETVTDLLHSSLDLFSVNLSALTIASFDRKIISPLAINGNLVTLCSVIDGNSELLIAHGYGFVRGIDVESDTLVLLTPQPIETMERVSHLVVSSVTTPPSLIMTANGVKGHIPYVGTGDLVNFGQFTKRSYLPPRT